MLSILHIENIAVIQSADIQFDGGFNVLTGETGAGKSIVVDAIGALLGGRTSRDLIRTGAKIRVGQRAVYRPPRPGMVPGAGDGVLMEDGVLLLQRELRGDGKKVCRLNGRPVTLSQLRELGHQLLDIHGQHDGQRLLDPACHLDYLDSFGETGALLEQYQTAYHSMAQIKRQIDALEIDEAEKARKIDTLSYQIQELERAELRPGEDEALAERKRILRNAGKMTDAVNGAFYALYGTDEEQGAVDLVANAADALDQAGRYSDRFSALSEKLSDLRYELEDVAELLRDQKEDLEFSPGELDELESRLDVIYRLRKKYGNTVEEMLDYLARCRKELAEIQDSSASVGAAPEKAGTPQSVRLSARARHYPLCGREKAAMLEKRIQAELAGFDMPKVQFQVEFTPKTCAFCHGCDWRG